MQRIVSAFIVVVAFAVSAGAQQPRVINGKVEPHAVSGTLSATLRQLAGTGEAPVWIGYAVPAVQTRPRLICCFDSSNFGGNFAGAGCCSGCRLEGPNNGFFNSDGGTCVQPDPPSHILVWLRFAQGQLTRVRPTTPDCGIDAGGLTVHWLADVHPAESVAFLAAAAGLPGRSSDEMWAGRGSTGTSLADMTVAALAMHADPAADAALDQLVAPEQPEKTRQKAAFWMASERGKHGFETLRRLARADKDDRFREHLTFPISISSEPEAIPELIRMAHQDEAPRVRGQALFWLSQKAGKKVAGEISDAIENDRDTDVKKKAVFALAQLSDGEGVPKLIEVARNNRNPAVRKQAIFWLGQSHDPRALAFI